MRQPLLSRFAQVVRDSKIVGPDERLLLDRDGPVSIYYAPFEHLNPKARVVIVGITPGPTQMGNAIRAARTSLGAGKSESESLVAAKKIGAFSGEVFRNNLVRQLDHWGLHQWLRIDSTARLFDSASDLVHTTSLLRFPVFVNGRKYEGRPNMMRQQLLRRYVLDYFAEETRILGDATFVGLGSKVWQVLSQLAKEGTIDPSRVMNGVLHASPENTYRVNYLTGDRGEPVPWKTNPEAYDEGRGNFRRTYLGTRE